MPARPIYSPATMPAPPAPDPVLLYIQQALLALAARGGTSGRRAG